MEVPMTKCSPTPMYFVYNEDHKLYNIYSTDAALIDIKKNVMMNNNRFQI